MICDEVICGFGRLGTRFGCQAFGFEPHSITVAKALTSAYVPMAALTVPEVMYQAMLDESRKIGTFGHGFTYTGHPVAAAVALKTLEIYERERLVERAAKLAPQFQARLAALGERIRWSARRAAMAWSAPSNWSPTRPPSARSIRRRASDRARWRLPRGRGCCCASSPAT